MNAPGPSYRLRVTPPKGPPFEHELGEGELILGRSQTSDLAVADPYLSRRHVRIIRRGDRVTAEDLGSINGTLLNDVPTRGATRLRAGDRLRLSSTVVELLGPGDDGGNEAGGDEAGDDEAAGGRGPRAAAARAASSGSDQSIFLSASEVLEAQSRELGPDRGERAVRRAAERLRLLNEIHEAASSSMSQEQLLELILDRAFDHLEPEEGAVYLRRGDGVERSAVRTLAEADRPYPHSESLVREVIGRGLAALVLDVETDRRFSAVESLINAGVRSLIAAPLLVSEGTLGMIVLSSRLASRRFSQEDLELLISLASVAALRLRNISLAEEAAERRRLEEEVRLARQVQVALVPRKLPEPPGWQLYAGTVPSRGVSGDFYLALERAGGDELLLMVADVSGKGMGAALLMASLEALCAPAMTKGLAAEEVCREVSPLLFQRTPAAKYATAFLAVVDVPGGRLRYANAGHNPAVVLRAGGDGEELDATGMPLGLVDGAGYENRYDGREVELAPGDTLLVYSDGLVEAESPSGEEHGLERLIGLCRDPADRPLGAVARRIEAALAEFTGGVPPSDDRTLLLLRRKPASR